MGSIAHATMLAKAGVLTDAERDQIIANPEGHPGRDRGRHLRLARGPEDVHMNIEARLTDRIGIVGKKLHTGRSRNDRSPPTSACGCATKST